MLPPGETVSCRVVIRVRDGLDGAGQIARMAMRHPHDLTERGVVWRGRGCGFPIMRKAPAFLTP
jgi:hypothetical protein